jgi:hypothetical protein
MICSSVNRLRFIRPSPSGGADSTYTWRSFQGSGQDAGEDGINLLSKQIIGCALTVLYALGSGFLEKVYENALVQELRTSSSSN